MAITLRQLVQLVPLDEKIKQRVLEEEDTLTADQKFQISKICWNLLSTIIETRVQQKTEEMLREIARGKAEYTHEDFSRVEDEVLADILLQMEAVQKQDVLQLISELKNGNRIATPSNPSNQVIPPVRKSTEWEYKDFVYSFPKGSRPARYSASIVQTRSSIWNELQKLILPELQKWIDDGWEPVTEIGPSGLEWRSYKKIEVSFSSILFCFLLYPIPLIVDLTTPSLCEEVTAYRVKMRRPK